MKHYIVFDPVNNGFVPVEVDEWGNVRHLRIPGSFEDAMRELSLALSGLVYVEVRKAP